jgi:Replicative DNA helicase
MTRKDNWVDDEYDKPLPSNDEAERVILGAVILEPSLIEIVIKLSVVGDYHNPRHRRILEAMIGLHDQGEIIDPIKIGEQMKKMGVDPFQIGGTATITNLIYGLPHFNEETITEYLKTLRTHSVARRVSMLCESTKRSLLSGKEDVEEVVDSAEAALLSLSTELHRETKPEQFGFVSLAEITPSLAEQFSNYEQGIRTGVRTGMDEIDDKLDGGGLQQGVYLVGAPEKIGKTSLVLDWAYNIATNENRTVPIATGEMAKETLVKRLYSAHAGISYYKFRPNKLQGDIYRRAVEGLYEFAKIPIVISDRLRTMSQIRRAFIREKEKALKRGVPMGAGVIDYMQLIELDGPEKGATERVTRVSREVKLLSTELELPLLVISNLNRMGLSEGQEPDTFNLRDSGSLAFDAEAIFFLHNPNYHPGKPYEPKAVTDLTLILARQRNGPTGRFKMKFIGEYMQFMTEKEYRKAFGDPNEDGSLSTQGQRDRKGQRMLDNWGEDDGD